MNKSSIVLFNTIYLAAFLFLQNSAIAFDCCGCLKRPAQVLPEEIAIAQPAHSPINQATAAPIETEALATPSDLAQIVVSVQQSSDAITRIETRYLNNFIVISVRGSVVSARPLHIGKLDKPRLSVFFEKTCDIISE